MITHKLIENKFYLYKDGLVKIKKIHKTTNNVIVRSVLSDEETIIPFTGGELLLMRVYTIGEVAKMTQKRTDTIRKYEKNGLIPKASYTISDEENCYKNWRFYTESDVYDMIGFFSGRSPGRPAGVKNNNIKDTIVSLKQKVDNL